MDGNLTPPGSIRYNSTNAGIELGEQQQNVQNYWKEKAKPQQREMFKSVFKRCHAVLESSRIMTWK